MGEWSKEEADKNREWIRWHSNPDNYLNNEEFYLGYLKELSDLNEAAKAGEYTCMELQKKLDWIPTMWQKFSTGCLQADIERLFRKVIRREENND